LSNLAAVLFIWQFYFEPQQKIKFRGKSRFKFFRSHQKHSLARARTMIERGRTEYLKVELDFVAKPAEFLFLWSLSLSFFGSWMKPTKITCFCHNRHQDKAVTLRINTQHNIQKCDAQYDKECCATFMQNVVCPKHRCGRNNIEHNDIMNNDTQHNYNGHNDTQPNDSQHNNKTVWHSAHDI